MYALVNAQWARRPYSLIVREDGPLEMAQVCFYMLTSVTLIYTSRTLAAAGKPYLRLLFLVVSFMVLFVAFEETSWLQRVFHFQTPDYFKEHNRQREFNFHNIHDNEGGLTTMLLRAFIIWPGYYVLACTVLFPLLKRYWKGLPAEAVFLVPPAHVLLHFLSATFYLYTLQYPGCCHLTYGIRNQWRFQECMETMYSLGCLLTSLHFLTLARKLPDRKTT